MILEVKQRKEDDTLEFIKNVYATPISWDEKWGDLIVMIAREDEQFINLRDVEVLMLEDDLGPQIVDYDKQIIDSYTPWGTTFTVEDFEYEGDCCKVSLGSTLWMYLI